ncbi:MAG: hypothetical protein RLZ84_365, partial [Actinomycetota bacterium]
MEVLQHDVPGPVGGAGEVADGLTSMPSQDGSGRVGRVRRFRGLLFHVEQRILPKVFLPVGEPRDGLVARLDFHPMEIDGLANQPGRSPGLESSQSQPDLRQGPGKAQSRRLTSPPSGGHDDRFSKEPNLHRGVDSDHPTVLDHKAGGLGLLAVQVRLTLAHPLQPKLVGLLVTLRPGGPNRRPLLGVQHPELQPTEVRGLAHFPSDGVDLPCQMPFGQPSHRRVARHLADRVELDGQQQGFTTHPGGCQRGLDTGVSSSDHDDIVPFG